MAKKKDDIDIARLGKAVNNARSSLQFYREERRDAVKEYVGAHWSEDAKHEIVPVNLLALYTSIVSRSLIAKNPRVMLSTFDRNLKPSVSALESWANEQIETLYLANTLQRIVLDAFFSIGICKVALATPADSAMHHWQPQAGQPLASRVDLDDFVFDIHARDFSEVSFIGHRYRAPLEVIRESKLYSKARKDLTASADAQYNHEGDERLATLGRGNSAGDFEEFEDFVDLWEIYLPRHRLILTLADDKLTGAAELGDDGPLREQEWIGPDCGPYHILGFATVPGNAMPKAPIQDLIDLHNLTNRLYRKLGNQAERQKEITLASNTEEGERVRNAADGEMIRCDRPDATKVVNFGGANQQGLGMAIHIKDLFAYLAGNLDMMGGLSPQSKTLGQDQLLAANASRSVADMQDRTVSHAAAVLKSMCWYWWHDPFHTIRANYSVPGLPEFSTIRKVSPQQRQRGKFEYMDIRVDPYSMQHATPQSRLQGIMTIVKEVYLPLAPLAMQQGITLDLNQLFQMAGKYLDQPDLTEIIRVQEPPMQGQGGPGGPAAAPAPEVGGMPGSTTRNYVRESMPGKTKMGQDNVLMQQLMGGNPQESKNGQMLGAG